MTTKTTRLTKQQQAALDTLRRKHFTVRADGLIDTGINTTLLHALNKAGVISCSRIFLRGRVSADLRVSGWMPPTPTTCPRCFTLTYNESGICSACEHN